MINDFDAEWQQIWVPVLYQDGVLDAEQVKKEIHDYSMLLGFVPKVYDAVTGGRVSKPNTLPDAVIEQFQDHVQCEIDEACKDLNAEIADLRKIEEEINLEQTAQNRMLQWLELVTDEDEPLGERLERLRVAGWGITLSISKTENSADQVIRFAELEAENAELRERLAEAEEAIRWALKCKGDVAWFHKPREMNYTEWEELPAVQRAKERG